MAISCKNIWLLATMSDQNLPSIWQKILRHSSDIQFYKYIIMTSLFVFCVILAGKTGCHIWQNL